MTHKTLLSRSWRPDARPSQKTLETLLVTQRSPLITGQEEKKKELLGGLNPNTEVGAVR